jgi:hypothetical protein
MSRWKNFWAKWGPGDEDTAPAKMDPVTEILAVIQSEHLHMHEEEHYFVKTFIFDTGGVDSTTYFSFTTPNTTVRIHAKTRIALDVDAEVRIFEDATVSGGTPIIGKNNDRDSTITPDLTTLAAPTIDVAGTEIWTARNGGGKSPVGIAPGSTYEIIAKTNSTYVFEITKKTTADLVADIDFWWYEEIPKH